MIPAEADTSSYSAVSVIATEDTSSSVDMDSRTVSASLPVLAKDDSTSDSVNLTLTSATCEGVSIKIRVGKKIKMRKVMKKFGQKFNVDYKVLKFLLGGRELGGEELVRDLNESQIDVWGALN